MRVMAQTHQRPGHMPLGMDGGRPDTATNYQHPNVVTTIVKSPPPPRVVPGPCANPPPPPERPKKAINFHFQCRRSRDLDPSHPTSPRYKGGGVPLEMGAGPVALHTATVSITGAPGSR